MNKRYDIVVIGAGIVGMTSALAMHQRGFSVALLDSNKIEKTNPGCRMYALNEASRLLLDQVGVWDTLENNALSPYEKMQVWDAKSGAEINFDARLIITKQLGHIIEESIIKNALLDALNLAEKVTLLPQSRVVKIEFIDNLNQISFEENTIQSTLLMVADGANSPSRESLKVPMASWSYNQHALVATVQCQKKHQMTAYQVFHPEGPLAFLPMKDSHECSIVWTTTPMEASRLQALSETDFNQALNQAFAEKLGEISVITKRHTFPLTMRHVKNYTGKNWLLLGDCAHTIHPLAGLGLNLGLADITTWLNCLAENKNSLHSSKALGQYQRHRKNAVWQVIMLMEGLKRLFGNDLSPVVALRSLGLRAFDSLTLLKKMIMREAAGY